MNQLQETSTSSPQPRATSTALGETDASKFALAQAPLALASSITSAFFSHDPQPTTYFTRTLEGIVGQDGADDHATDGDRSWTEQASVTALPGGQRSRLARAAFSLELGDFVSVFRPKGSLDVMPPAPPIAPRDQSIIPHQRHPPSAQSLSLFRVPAKFVNYFMGDESWTLNVTEATPVNALPDNEVWHATLEWTWRGPGELATMPILGPRLPKFELISTRQVELTFERLPLPPGQLSASTSSASVPPPQDFVLNKVNYTGIPRPQILSWIPFIEFILTALPYALDPCVPLSYGILLLLGLSSAHRTEPTSSLTSSFPTPAPADDAHDAGADSDDGGSEASFHPDTPEWSFHRMMRRAHVWLVKEETVEKLTDVRKKFVDALKAVISFVKAIINFVKAVINFLKTVLDFVKMVAQHVEQTWKEVKSVSDFLKWVIMAPTNVRTWVGDKKAVNVPPRPATHSRPPARTPARRQGQGLSKKVSFSDDVQSDEPSSAFSDDDSNDDGLAPTGVSNMDTGTRRRKTYGTGKRVGGSASRSGSRRRIPRVDEEEEEDSASVGQGRSQASTSTPAAYSRDASSSSAASLHDAAYSSFGSHQSALEASPGTVHEEERPQASTLTAHSRDPSSSSSASQRTTSESESVSIDQEEEERGRPHWHKAFDDEQPVAVKSSAAPSSSTFPTSTPPPSGPQPVPTSVDIEQLSRHAIPFTPATTSTSPQQGTPELSPDTIAPTSPPSVDGPPSEGEAGQDRGRQGSLTSSEMTSMTSGGSGGSSDSQAVVTPMDSPTIETQEKDKDAEDPTSIPMEPRRAAVPSGVASGHGPNFASGGGDGTSARPISGSPQLRPSRVPVTPNRPPAEVSLHSTTSNSTLSRYRMGDKLAPAPIDPGSAQSLHKPALNPTSEVLLKMALGGASNMTAACFTNPFDLVKVRQQMEKTQKVEGKTVARSTNWVTTLRQMVVAEGPRSLWKGLSASVLREGSYSGIRMGGYDFAKGGCAKLMPFLDKDSFGIKLSAGMLTGCIGAAIANPADLLKVQMQAYGATGTLRSTAAKIYQARGIAGLYRAVWPTTIRAGILTSSQLGVYDQAKQLLMYDFPGVFREGFGTHLAASGIAGFACSAASSPVDVIKVRMMTDTTKQYKNAFHCTALILKNEGPLALYKGFTMCFLRLWPHSVISLLVFEQLRRLSGLAPI
ncbi:hypothetical protein MNV49_005003 [Pseudohyphozyma bogoriensis]|nr:hypothetical protein MNV49_005003 [Pseudohyphozyma bogoriensis]